MPCTQKGLYLMTGEERRASIIRIIKAASEPVSGSRLAREFHVSRQVIVQDLALLRAEGYSIDSTYRGYVLHGSQAISRVFKVIHTDEEVGEELRMIVDLGGVVEDVFVYHKVYGIIRGNLHLRSRKDIDHYLSEIRDGKSSLLKNTTSGYHYHTVTADSESDLDLIQQKLSEAGFLAPLQDYEPVDFKNRTGS